MHGEDKKRTDQQRKAIEVYCRLLACALNEAGLDIRATLKADFEIPWTQASVKELIWRQVQIAMHKDKSTTQISPTEVDEIYRVIDRHMLERHGVDVPFPDRFGG